ncbi:hypothetical protein OE279_23040, partial [Klebsiella quasipneumoniae]|nr:hypothetical protein [Klebsiella quasipneumoniae]
MSDLQESPVWVDGIYQLTDETPVLGKVSGEESIGPSNLQAQQLANRTQFLREKLNSLDSYWIADKFIEQFNQQAQDFDAQLTSQESRYEEVLQQAGKIVLGRYEDGPWTLTNYNQLVSYGGTFWKLAASVVIGSGYTTAGKTDATWNATDKANFVDVGQDQLRSELGTVFMPG